MYKHRYNEAQREEILRKYSDEMSIIKLRTEQILSASNKFDYKEPAVEYKALQLRKIIEQILLASLVANAEEYKKYHDRLGTEWNAKYICQDLIRINPDFFPKAVNNRTDFHIDDKPGGSVVGTMCTQSWDGDGTVTAIIQGLGRDSYSMNTGGTTCELVLYPVPDRVIYGYSDSKKLLWGEPLNDDRAVLPRLALAYYLLIAGVSAAVSGLLWFIFRGKKSGIIMRQVFFAPIAYIAAHILLKGTATTSYFMGRELYFILVIAAAVYFLFTLTWQVWLQRRHER